MTPERRDAIVRLLRTRDDNLPEPVRRTEASAGFVNKSRPRTCPDCLANGRVMFGCETCGGSGEVSRRALHRLAVPDELPDDGDRRDPYAEAGVVPFGFDPSRHDAARDRDRQIAMLERQTAPPMSEADLLAEANEHPYVWELERRRMYRDFDYAALDRALDELRGVDYSAYRALHAVFVYRWLAECDAPHAHIERGIVFLDDHLPETLRAPAPEKPLTSTVRGPMRPEAGKYAKHLRDGAMRAAADAGATLAELMESFGVSKSTVYSVVNRKDTAA